MNNFNFVLYVAFISFYQSRFDTLKTFFVDTIFNVDRFYFMRWHRLVSVEGFIMDAF